MPTDLHDLLEDAAATGPAPDAEAIWQAGRTRARRRVAATAAGLVLVVGLAVGSSTALTGPPPPEIGPVDATPRPRPTRAPSPNVGTMAPADPTADLSPGQSMLRARSSGATFDLLARPDGVLQPLAVPAIAGRHVMLSDGTLVYEGFEDDGPGGDPAVWAMPMEGDPVRLAPGTTTAGQRVLLGRDDPGDAAIVLLAEGTVEAWSPSGDRTEVAEVTGSLPGDVTSLGGSWNGNELVLARRGSTRIDVQNEASSEDGQVIVAPDGQYEVRDVAHVGEEVAVLLEGAGDREDVVLLMGPRTREDPARLVVPTDGDAVGLAVHDGTIAVHVLGDTGWAPTPLLQGGREFGVAVGGDGPVLLHDAATASTGGDGPPSCDPTSWAVDGAGPDSDERPVRLWAPCGSEVVKVEVVLFGPPPPPATAVEERLARLFAEPSPAAAEAGFTRPWRAEAVRGVRFEGGTAVVDLVGAAMDGFPGGATLAATLFHESVAGTALLVDGVDAVRFQVDGSCEDWATRNESGECIVLTRDDLDGTGPPSP
jgi:hypothetical protein